MAALADSLGFEHKYTSGVIAWGPEDRPTDEQIGAVLDEFEKTAWAGLEPGRYAWTAFLHREDGDGVHVHVLTARCDLETGRSLNIAPPGWQKTFDALRDAFNHQHGWSRPDDPARAKAHQPGHRAYLEAAKLRAGLEHEAGPRELIRDYLPQRVEHGAVRSRADVVAALEEAGFEVPRQRKDYLTARDPESGKRWRLRGALYEQDFRPERLDRSAPEPAGDRTPSVRGDGGERAAAAWRELARRREWRAAYHRRRYSGDGRADTTRLCWMARGIRMWNRLDAAQAATPQLQSEVNGLTCRRHSARHRTDLPACSDLPHPSSELAGRIRLGALRCRVRLARCSLERRLRERRDEVKRSGHLRLDHRTDR